ncbi:MAG: NADPH-dependent F420 reductase [Acidobacteriota bacterium]|jgi:predicted dinucleotide-binding enzyme
MNIAFLGYGQVGAPLADHLARAGHNVTLGAAEPFSDRALKALRRNAELKAAPPREAILGADVVFLATPFAANEAVLMAVATELVGKVLVDCTNPVGPGLNHGLNSARSGTEMIQTLLPATKVVKAFTIYGFENLENSAYPGYNVKPAMLFCGADAAAKQRVARLIGDLGWEPVDTGGIEQALPLEHMTLLWIRMVRLGGQSPHLVWAALRR